MTKVFGSLDFCFWLINYEKTSIYIIENAGFLVGAFCNNENCFLDKIFAIGEVGRYFYS